MLLQIFNFNFFLSIFNIDSLISEVFVFPLQHIADLSCLDTRRLPFATVQFATGGGQQSRDISVEALLLNIVSHSLCCCCRSAGLGKTGAQPLNRIGGGKPRT